MRRISPSEESVSKLLTVRRVEVSVDEPWDFEGPHGTNLLAGRVTGVGQDDSGDHASQWVMVALAAPFAGKGGAAVEHLEARGRHRLPRGIVEQIASEETAIVHLGYADQVRREDLPEGSSPFLIGGVRLADREPEGERPAETSKGRA